MKKQANLWLFLCVGLVGLLGFSRSWLTRLEASSAADFRVYLPHFRATGGIWGTTFATGLAQPTSIKNDGTDRLYVTEREGTIRIIEADGTLLSNLFLDISDEVNANFTEQGLLGLAFHPDYAGNGRFYLTYTNQSGDVVLSRFTVSGDNPDAADAGSETPLLTVTQYNAAHQGGDLAFGPDGYLYISLGDGGYGTGVDFAQRPDYLVGKILRLDVDGGEPYAIPADNPFVGVDGAYGEIWQVGFRNPWRISFDAGTGDLYIGDVGESSWEEVDVLPASTPGGLNFGWRCYEGFAPLNLDGCGEEASFTFPAAVYAHDAGNCAITGGYVYRGTQYPALQGTYLFADFCGGVIWGLSAAPAGTWQMRKLGEVGHNVTTFGQGSDGELYVADTFDGHLIKLGYTP